MKTAVADDMASASSNTHLLLVTQAYGMGVDAPDIGRAVHAGAPTTLEGNYNCAKLNRQVNGMLTSEVTLVTIR